MNASAQAQSISIVSKIANVSTIVNAQFPTGLVDFSPWLLDEQVQEQFDPGSIDISFSFPEWQPQLSCSCMLLQIYFFEKLQSPDRSLNRIKLTGHDYRGQHWRFSTHADWQFSGLGIPSQQQQQQLKFVVSQLHTLFGRSVPVSR